jgi:hypothetical protein
LRGFVDVEALQQVTGLLAGYSGGSAQFREVDDGIRTLNGGEAISPVSYMPLQGLASRSTECTLRMYQQSNSLDYASHVFHT